MLLRGHRYVFDNNSRDPGQRFRPEKPLPPLPVVGILKIHTKCFATTACTAMKWYSLPADMFPEQFGPSQGEIEYIRHYLYITGTLVHAPLLTSPTLSIS